MYSTSFADSVPAPSADPEQCVKHRADAAQLIAADFSAIPDPIEMSMCDVDEVPVQSVISSDYAIEARVLRAPISPTEISSTATVTYPEGIVTPNRAERFLPVRNVAVAAVHPSHCEHFRLLVQLLVAHDAPNECAAALASCCIPQRVRHGAKLDVAPIPASLMDASVPPGPPALEATLHYDPTVSESPAATTVLAANQPEFAMPTSCVFCPTDGHAWVNKRTGWSTDLPSPASSVAVLLCPSQGHTDDDRCEVVQSGKRLRPDIRQDDPPSFFPTAVALLMQNASINASSLEALAAVNRMFRFHSYSASDVNRHVRTNVWCRTPEYDAALADAPCNHAACHCRLQFQQIPAALRRERLASTVPFHVVLQRCYDERYGYQSGQYLDSPSERKAVLR